MRSWLRWALAALAVYGGLQFAYTRWMLHRMQALAPAAVGERSSGQGETLRLFFAGDSVAAGYGATAFETSVAGRITAALAGGHHLVYTNVGVKGARMADVADQPVPAAQQDLVVIVAGSNDLLRLTPLDRLRAQTRAALARYAPRSERLALLGPGVIHQAGAMPWVLRPIYWARRPAYVELLREVCAELGVVYVDPADADPAETASFGDMVSAVDGFHPSDEGHRWWARRVLEELETTSGRAGGRPSRR